MALDNKKVKRLIGMMNEMTAVKIPAMKPIIKCFEIGMDEDILEYLLRVGTTGHTKESLHNLFDTMRATGEISNNRSWNEFWDEIMVMSFLIPQEHKSTYELASIFPGWIELCTSGPFTEKREAIMESFMDFWKLLKTMNVGPMRMLSDKQGIKTRNAGQARMGTLTSVTPAKRKRTIAVDQQLASEQKVLTKGTVFEVFARHKDDIAAMNCICRNHKRVNGDDTCDFDIPLESCMPVGAIARQLIESGVARHVPYEEAIQMVEDFERKGCIHTTFHYEGDADHEELCVCNCCTDCCLLYGGYQEGYLSKVQVKSYFKPVVVKPQECIGCNICKESCPTNAIYYDRREGRLVFDYDSCVGCGQCVNQCPFDVQKMVSDERPVYVKTKKTKVKSKPKAKRK